MITWFQGIEALDPSHQCLEYWNHKKFASSLSTCCTSDGTKLACGSSSSLSNDVKTKVLMIDLTKDENGNKLDRVKCESLEEMKLVLEGLLKKASVDELVTMQKLLRPDVESARWRVEVAALIEKIQNNM